MNWFVLVAGVVVLAVLMFDLVRTTLMVDAAAGPLTRTFTRASWALGRRFGSHQFLRNWGLIIVLAALAMWLVMLLVGWTLIFSASTTSVVTSTGERPVGFWQHAYYSGYTVLTLGNGEYKPNGAAWQMLAVVAVGSGLSVATLGITYLVPVTSAAVGKRQLASLISSLGPRADATLLRAWDGSSFQLLVPHLHSLTAPIAQLRQQHLAYPVLHYFHGRDRSNSAPVMIAQLDELLTLLDDGVAPGVRLPEFTLTPLYDVVTDFLDTLQSAFIAPADEPPPPPSLDRLRSAGIPVVDDEDFRAKVSARATRRRLLLGMIQTDGWVWEDVWPPNVTTRRRRATGSTPDTDEDVDEGAR